MIINIYIIIGVLLCHWVSDFVLQSDWQAKNKSTSLTALLAHTVTYTMAWIFPAFFLFGAVNALIFLGVTFVCHTITDYFTSKLNTKLWNEKKVHWFFVSVGFDQVLHYTQLFYTLYLLI